MSEASPVKQKYEVYLMSGNSFTVEASILPGAPTNAAISVAELKFLIHQEKGHLPAEQVLLTLSGSELSDSDEVPEGTAITLVATTKITECAKEFMQHNHLHCWDWNDLVSDPWPDLKTSHETLVEAVGAMETLYEAVESSLGACDIFYPIFPSNRGVEDYLARLHDEKVAFDAEARRAQLIQDPYDSECLQIQSGEWLPIRAREDYLIRAWSVRTEVKTRDEVIRDPYDQELLSSWNETAGHCLSAIRVREDYLSRAWSVRTEVKTRDEVIRDPYDQELLSSWNETAGHCLSATRHYAEACGGDPQTEVGSGWRKAVKKGRGILKERNNSSLVVDCRSDKKWKVSSGKDEPKVRRFDFDVDMPLTMDWSSLEYNWRHVYQNDHGCLNLSSHSILVVEPVLSPHAWREAVAKVFLSDFGVPSIAFAMSSVLGLYGCEEDVKTTGLMVEVGEVSCHVVPIWEGFLIPHAIQCCSSKAATALACPGRREAQDVASQRSPIEAIVESVGKCDIDLRADLFGGIKLLGEFSRVDGWKLRYRLQSDVSTAIHSRRSVEVSLAREDAIMLGGSLLCRRHGSEHLFVSKEEYSNLGPSVIHERCL
eukprot:TRINITY_DN13593_c1_g1_i1.p1 TRINITY_DN13593_c1_g1~~TRINITY_DN13593_c1_g1_i1.p1  ORF type:complete len:598 (-),score=86.20 TRINITY_DN13593_c1_g1_i1:355-2148(-)